MKRSGFFSIFTLLAIGSILSSYIQAGLDDITAPLPPLPNPCPDGYIYQLDEKNLTVWDVCIASAIYDKADVSLLVNQDCPVLDNAEVRQEKNLEANICFTRKETVEDKILDFRLTRDATYANAEISGQIRVDLFNDQDAQCIGAGRRFSPLGVYCLIDIETVYSLDYINSNVAQHVEDLFDCEPLEEAQIMANAYNSYMDFAYYSNDSITLEKTLPEPHTTRTKGSRKNSGKQLDLDINSKSTEEECNLIRIKEMTGVTN